MFSVTAYIFAETRASLIAPKNNGRAPKPLGAPFNGYYQVDITHARSQCEIDKMRLDHEYAKPPHARDPDAIVELLTRMLGYWQSDDFFRAANTTGHPPSKFMDHYWKSSKKAEPFDPWSLP